MKIIVFWLSRFQEGFMAFWGIIFLIILILRLVKLFSLNIDEYYVHPPIGDVLTLASMLGVIYAVLRSIYHFSTSKT